MPIENKHSVLAPSSMEWVRCGYSAKFLATKEEETAVRLQVGSPVEIDHPFIRWIFF